MIAREDDTEEALEIRLRNYHEKTDPVLDLFGRKEYVITIDAREDVQVVYQRIREELDRTAR